MKPQPHHWMVVPALVALVIVVRVAGLMWLHLKS
jgi:hypothetical protein